MKLMRNWLITACIMTAFVISLGFPVSALAVKQGGILKLATGLKPVKPGDPHNTLANGDQSIGGHIFEQLVDWVYDENTKQAEVKPSLAESWIKSSDGKVWTFYLRKGVKFHDGTPFNAEAVKFSLDRLTAKKPKAIQGRNLRGIVDRTEVVNNSTVKIYLKQSSPLFLPYMGELSGSILSPAALKKYGKKIARHPIGTGPFKVKKWVTAQFIDLEANRNYWGGKPNLDGIRFRFVPDNSARINMLLTGEVDVAFNIPVQDHARINKNKDFEVLTFPTAGIMRLMLDCGVGPTKEIAVRQAMNYAIDKKTIVNDILQGVAEIPRSVVAPGSWGYYAADKSSYNPEKAKRLLKNAGWVDRDGDGIREKNGKKLILSLYTSPPGRYLMGSEIALALQEYLRNVGIDFKVQFLEWGAITAKLFRTVEKTTGKIQFMFDYSSRTDGMFILKWLWSGSWYPKKWFLLFYKNQEFDDLYAKASGEDNANKRMKLYRRMQEIAADEQPIINLYVMSQTLAKRKNIHGISTVPVPTHKVFMHVREAWID